VHRLSARQEESENHLSSRPYGGVQEVCRKPFYVLSPGERAQRS
jgi:hypothetical protein